MPGGEWFGSPGSGISAAAPTIVPIQETVLASDTASPFTFSSIPQNFQHLVVEAMMVSSRAVEQDGLNLTLNGDGGGNYDSNLFSMIASVTNVQGIGSTQFLGFQMVPGASATAGTAALLRVMLPFYSQTTFRKNARFEITGYADLQTASTDARVVTGNGLWRSTAAITSLTLALSVGPNFKAGSAFNLYGWR